MSKFVILLCVILAVLNEQVSATDLSVVGIKGGSVKGGSVNVKGGTKGGHFTVPLATGGKGYNNQFANFNKGPSSVGHSRYHIDDFINYFRSVYKYDIEDREYTLGDESQHYSERLNTVHFQLAYVSQKLKHLEEYLNPMEVLSDENKQCISKHRSWIPLLPYVEQEFLKCYNKDQKNIAGVLSKAKKTKAELAHQFEYNFENNFANCSRSLGLSPEKHIRCAIDVVQRIPLDKLRFTFKKQLEEADCDATQRINDAVNCSSYVQMRIISSITIAKELIDNCISKRNVCPPCNSGTCSELYVMNNNSQTILNPVFGRHNTDCVILKAK